VHPKALVKKSYLWDPNKISQKIEKKRAFFGHIFQLTFQPSETFDTPYNFWEVYMATGITGRGLKVVL
jgi:hypothetical protein